MAPRGKYRTRQREIVACCMEAHGDRYLTVDEVCAAISASGESVGRTTVYRALEALAADATLLKATAPGGEASYRLCPEGSTGQLVCLECGHAFTLDCHMADDFNAHVLEHHGFKVLPSRTVLYGLCKNCMGAAHA